MEMTDLLLFEALHTSECIMSVLFKKKNTNLTFDFLINKLPVLKCSASNILLIVK